MCNKNDSRSGSAQDCTYCVIVHIYAMEKCQAQRKGKTVLTSGEDKDTDSIGKMIHLENGHCT